MERLAPVQLAEHFEDAGDLTARARFGPPLRGAREERTEVAVLCIFERETVEDTGRICTEQRKRVVDANRARMVCEQLPEVRLPQPADAEDLPARRAVLSPSGDGSRRRGRAA